MIEQWKKQLQEFSGNLTTNAPMPEHFIAKLLEEDLSLQEKLKFEETNFEKLSSPLNIQGLEIIAGLQKKTKKEYITVFRAIRFPTFKRMHDMLNESGYAIANYEQGRILELYKDESYVQKRQDIKIDPLFWTQPQERVVQGLPIFTLVNDALQIHRAYRGDSDKVALIAIHIPIPLLTNGTIKLIANTAIDMDFGNEDRDINVNRFKEKNGFHEIDYSVLRAQGVDLHEMYTQNLPFNIIEATQLGIEQEYYLLDIYKLGDEEIKQMNLLFENADLIKENEYFLHGFFGDQNIFGRRKAKYLPYKCQRISKNES